MSGGVGGPERALRDHSFPIASQRFEDAMPPIAIRTFGRPPLGLARPHLAREEGRRRPAGSFPNLKRLFEAVDSRRAVAHAREVGKDHPFKRVNDEDTDHRFGG